MAVLNVNDITTGAIDGTGTFDVLMKTVFLHLQREYSANRITGDAYAKAYIEIMNNTLAQATQYIVSASQASANEDLIKAQIDQIRSQIELIGYQGVSEQAKYKDVVNGLNITGSIGKQKDVYTAQIKGFKDSALQSIAKTMMDIWSVQRSTDEGIIPTPESKLYDGNIGNAVTEMLTNAGITIAPPPSIPAQSLKVGIAYTFDVTPYIVLPSGAAITSYSASGTLPTGITFTAGVFKGTPTATGTFVIDITGTGSGQSITRSITMTVAAAAK